MFGVEEAKDYMMRMHNAIVDKLINPQSVYSGRDGHERLARECGYVLNDFNEEGRQEILKGSYSVIYVRGCNLKPILDAKEWIRIMKQQIKER